jgi:tetratricopeptide (TPR) repeat protein
MNYSYTSIIAFLRGVFILLLSSFFFINLLHAQSANNSFYTKIINDKKFADSLIRFYKLKASSSVLNNEKYKALNELSIIYNNLNKFDSSFYFSKLLLNDLEKFPNLESVIFNSISSNFAIGFSKVGQYNDAIEFCNRIRNYYIKNLDTLRILDAGLLLGNFYRQLNLYDQQLVEHKKIFDIIKITSSIPNADKPAYLASSFGNLGDAYMMKGIYDSALYYIQESYRMSQNLDSANRVFPLINMGEIYLKNNQPQIAALYLQNAEKYILNLKSFDDDYGLNYIYNDLAQCYEKLTNIDSSYYFYKKSFNIANSRNRFDILSSTSQKLSEISFKRGNTADAYLYLKKHVEFLSIIASKDSILKIQSTIAKNMELEIKRQDELESSKKFRRKSVQIAVIAALIPIITISVYRISRVYKRKRTNKKTIAFLGLISTLMIFEFINLLIHPILDKITNHNIYFMYFSLLIIAIILSPLHSIILNRLSSFKKSQNHIIRTNKHG